MRIFCGSREGPLYDLLAPEVDVIVTDPPMPRSTGSLTRVGFDARDYFAEHPVDVLFVPGNFHWPVIPPIALTIGPARPAIVAQISNALRKPQRGWLRQELFNRRMRVLLRRVDALVALSDEPRDQANAIMRRNCALTIPLPALSNTPLPPVPLPAARAIVAAARLVPEKGFVDLINAFAAMRDPDATLTIVGSGPMEAELRALVRQHGLDDRVRLVGYAADVRPWLDQARIFVLSSHFEGYGAVLIEALAAGRPVVTTNCTPAMTELVTTPAAGRVVPIHDPNALAAAMRDLLDAPPPDPDALAASVARFRIEPVADEYLRLFHHVVAQRRAA
ncbi:glycosyltransferase involved in cell wall biosynthesis [Sphingobium subterraneum]|uniref:Glycosyltransferase involved in cell wall biosynthesis n=1 Tax=Sphingobium subterraneum TaxID=627688 RepID=A0A841J9B8_9SPHN|nr:glycosyltransferase involved in cell wall biosynthesis [Sphingobium subterraneum]